MSYKNLLYSSLIFSAVLFFMSSFDAVDKPNIDEDEVLMVSDQTIKRDGGIMPPCLKLYHTINKYADMYNIPRRYAFGVAYKETHYMGPFHWEYKPSQTSFAGAIGPMQIMPSTGDLMWKKRVSRDKLMHNIDFNVQTSMMLLRKLYDKYGDWPTVFGAYNTGRPCVNGYATDVHNFSYNWVSH